MKDREPIKKSIWPIDEWEGRDIYLKPIPKEPKKEKPQKLEKPNTEETEDGGCL